MQRAASRREKDENRYSRLLDRPNQGPSHGDQTTRDGRGSPRAGVCNSASGCGNGAVSERQEADLLGDGERLATEFETVGVESLA